MASVRANQIAERVSDPEQRTALLGRSARVAVVELHSMFLSLHLSAAQFL